MLYFVETDGGYSKQLAKDAGLSHAFEGPVTNIRTNQGPTGKPGLVLHNANFEYRGYDPSHQRWRNIPGAKAMVGVDSRVDLHPDQLKRSNALKGMLVQLADDQPWEIPIARKRWINDQQQLVYAYTLPQAQTCNDQGEWEAGPALPKYQALWDLAEDYSAQFFGGGVPREGAPDLNIWNNLLHAAATVLATNYRVGPAEISLLGLFSRQHAEKVMDVLIDAETLNAWLKKKAQEASAGVTT